MSFLMPDFVRSALSRSFENVLYYIKWKFTYLLAFIARSFGALRVGIWFKSV